MMNLVVASCVRVHTSFIFEANFEASADVSVIGGIWRAGPWSPFHSSDASRWTGIDHMRYWRTTASRIWASPEAPCVYWPRATSIE